MNLYNTKTKKIEKFIPHNYPFVNLYTCGPTVYHFAHIGNLRSYLMEDILEKSLTYLGYKVKRVMNITDIGHLTGDTDTGEDKMVKEAKEQKKEVLEIAREYTEAFFEDLKKLNIKKPEIIAKATDNIEEYIKLITSLIDLNYAYLKNGNIYFDTSKLKNYYVLTNMEESTLLEGVRDNVEKDLNKKNKNDFVLWFTKSKFANQELKWDSPWGEGYPGWHIECSGIAIKYLGEYLDIHCGGVDNIFPHHTNEIAQSESYLNHPWCAYWMHIEHLNDVNGKMSKSKGKTLTLKSLIDKGYDALSYRYLCLNSHYRKQLTFSYESLAGAQSAYRKLKNKIQNLDKNGTIDTNSFENFDNQFKKDLEDDLNTANCITLIFDCLKANISDLTKYELIKKWDDVLSLDLTKNKIIADETFIKEMIEKRSKAKEAKNYLEADKIRDELLKLNVVLEDTKEGVRYRFL